MNPATSSLGIWAIIWIVAAVGTVLIRWVRGESEVGLVWAYLANFWLIHWPAAVMYLLPWYSRIEYPTVYAGFVQSGIGVVGFAIGATAVGPLLTQILQPFVQEKEHHAPDALLPRTYILIGIAFMLVIFPLISRFPTVGALGSAAAQLILVGICLRCWHGWFSRNSRMYYGALALAALAPIVTVLGSGFLGFGAGTVIAVLCFNGVFIRPRWKVVLSAILIAYLGFSVYVTYMRDRSEIRRVVWGGETLTNRIVSVLGTVRNTEFFDPRNPLHLARIDMRLNQNYLVGASVEMMKSGARDPALGGTIWSALISVIPRALWPAKPVYGGSPDIVAEYTGMTFASGTSVGVGQTMEFYINFGATGVFVGFVILGSLIAIFDAWASRRLWVGDWQRFCMWFLGGIGLMQAGGSLVEVASTVAAGLLAAVLVNRYVVPALRSGPRSDYTPGNSTFPGFERS